MLNERQVYLLSRIMPAMMAGIRAGLDPNKVVASIADFAPMADKLDIVAAVEMLQGSPAKLAEAFLAIKAAPPVTPDEIETLVPPDIREAIVSHFGGLN